MIPNISQIGIDTIKPQKRPIIHFNNRGSVPIYCTNIIKCITSYMNTRGCTELTVTRRICVNYWIIEYIGVAVQRLRIARIGDDGIGADESADGWIVVSEIIGRCPYLFRSFLR